MTEPMPDFRRVTEQLSRLTSEMQRAREEIDSVDVHGASPGGLIRVTLRSGRLVAVTVEPAALETDPVRLADHILAAVQDGEQRSAAMLRRRTDPMAQRVQQMINETR